MPSTEVKAALCSLSFVLLPKTPPFKASSIKWELSFKSQPSGTDISKYLWPASSSASVKRIPPSSSMVVRILFQSTLYFLFQCTISQICRIPTPASEKCFMAWRRRYIIWSVGSGARIGVSSISRYRERPMISSDNSFICCQSRFSFGNSSQWPSICIPSL